jgi:hydroxymethylbilane synthase
MAKTLRIGTRDSQLAIWQATLVQDLLKNEGVSTELVYIKSEGDIDTITPLYALGVTGIFTKTLDAALLNDRIDIAVHSMKDVPTQMAQGIQQAAVLKRGSHKDIFVPHPDLSNPNAIFGQGVLEISHVTIITSGSKSKESVVKSTQDTGEPTDAVIATSSIRRLAQWRRLYPHHKIENLRGNVNTRLRKLKESNWSGAIFAAAGLERINLRPENAIDLDWMLPAPAQGAIMIVCRKGDDYAFESCQSLNDEETALCTKIERDFLSGLMGGCSTPISALAEVKDGEVHFKGNIVSPDSYHIKECNAIYRLADASALGFNLAKQILSTDYGQVIIDRIRNKGLTTDGEV